MARRYTRDARGRFASGGFSGQTGGRGARLMSGGRSRAGGGARLQAAAPAGAFRRGRARPSSKPTETTASRAGQVRGPKLQGVTRARLSGRKMSEGAGLRGKRRQERQQRMAIMDRWMARQGQSPSPAGVAALARRNRSEPLTTGGGTLAARSSLRRSRAKLRENDTPSQRGAVTRANRYAGMAIKRERVALGQSVQGRFVRGKGRPGSGPENNIRPTGGRIKSRGAANNIRQVKLNPSSRRTMRRELADSKRKIKAYTRRLMRVQRSYSQARATRLGIEAAAGTPDRMTPAQAKIHAKSVKTEKTAQGALREYKRGKTVIKPYRPTTARGRLNQLDRQINRDVADLGRSLSSMTSKIREVKPRLEQMKRDYERRNARHIANRRKRNLDGQIARTVLKAAGTTAGRKAISRRMQRALTAASRGSGPARRAVGVYLDQLAGMGPGKPSKARNNLRPGPRNTKGTPKRRRKGRG